MEKGTEKQREKMVKEVKDLAIKSGFDHTEIAVEARIGYPRYRRIFFDSAKAEPDELAAIRGAVLRLAERRQKELAELQHS